MLFVFDLDFTLWNCGDTWCDCTAPPFRIKDDIVFDSNGRHLRLYSDVPEILEELTVCILSEDRRVDKTDMFSTRETGYEDFLSRCNEYLEKGYEVRAAVESTGNARYFRNC